MRLKFICIVLLHLSTLLQAKQSTCFGSSSAGKIIDSVQLPHSEQNFKVFSSLAWYLGRTYVHNEVQEVILSTYKQLAVNLPNHIFMYAETGWSKGGDFAPHKTHQNGLSVDFMVPVLNTMGHSVYLPVGINNRWGYDIEFNAKGDYKSYAIDFEAMATHLKLMHEYADAQGFSIKRVFFDPQLQPLLLATTDGGFIQQHINFNSKQAWVRHDEHYHVDFAIECLPSM